MFQIKKYESIASISRSERSQFIVENTSQWQSSSQDCPSRIVACLQVLLTDKAFFFQQLKTRSACVLVAGTQRFFLPNVAKYYNKRKSNYFVTWKEESNRYSDKSWALINKYFWIIAIMGRNRLIPINCNYFCWLAN